MSSGGSAAVSTNSRQLRFGGRRRHDEPLRLAAGVQHDHHGRAAGSSRPLVPNTLVRLGPLACQSTACRRGRTSSRRAAAPGCAALPVRNDAAADVRLPAAEGDQRLHEAEHLGVLLDQLPVEPADRRCPGNRRCCCRAACGGTSSPDDDHRHALAQQQRGQQVLDLPLAERRRCSCGASGLRRRSWRCSCCCRRRGCPSPLLSCASARSSPGR